MLAQLLSLEHGPLNLPLLASHVLASATIPPISLATKRRRSTKTEENKRVERSILSFDANYLSKRGIV
ncbi:hypothetical protein NBB13_23825, partial [Salmonella sp. NW1215]